MVNDEKAYTSFSYPVYQFNGLFHQNRTEPCRHFIQKKQFRACRQSPGQIQSPLFTEGELAGGYVGFMGDADNFQKLTCHLSIFRAGMKRKSFTKNMADQHILQRAHPRERSGGLKRPADAQTTDRMRFKICDINAFKQNIAAAGPVSATDQIKQRCFAGTIGTHQANDLSFAKRKINIAQGAKIVKRLI